MPVLWGLWWFGVGASLTLAGLYLVWRTEQNKWLNWFGFHKQLPWYSVVAVILAGLITSGLWYFQSVSTWYLLLLQCVPVAILITTVISDAHFNAINVYVVAVGGLAVFLGIFLQQNWLPELASASLAAVIAVVFFLWQYLLSRGQWVGSGDAWLGAYLGLLVGWHAIVIVAAAGYALSALTAFILIVIFRRKNLNRLPLGAFLSLAALIYWLYSLIAVYG